MKNSLILSIPPNEAKIFVTKGKAPFLVAIEIFDPLEIAYDPGVLQRLEPGRLPTPMKEPVRKTRVKTKSPQEQLREEVEKSLDAQIASKQSGKKSRIKPIEDEAITIRKLKAQSSVYCISITKILCSS